ncbi:MAG: BlaI/MecI/CopY family transcriptional regulator [Planctomycetaceae bacterium]
MAHSLPSLGELEMQVLRLVWEHQPCTEKTITDLIAPERQVARTTILKTMQRLEGKGLLKRLPKTRPVQFRAAVEEQRVLPELVHRFVETVLGGSSNPLVSYLAGSEKLSQKDLKTLRDIARKLDAENE